jgi:hypothetical protein
LEAISWKRKLARFSADGSIYYRVSPSTRVGGEISINTFGSYDEFKSLIGIKQSLGGN